MLKHFPAFEYQKAGNACLLTLFRLFHEQHKLTMAIRISVLHVLIHSRADPGGRGLSAPPPRPPGFGGPSIQFGDLSAQFKS